MQIAMPGSVALGCDNGRVVEQLIAPRDDDVEGLVPRWHGDVDIEARRAAVGFGPRAEKPSSAVVVDDVEREPVAVSVVAVAQ
jgi:hypothetical protein